MCVQALLVGTRGKKPWWSLRLRRITKNDDRERKKQSCNHPSYTGIQRETRGGTGIFLFLVFVFEQRLQSPNKILIPNQNETLGREEGKTIWCGRSHSELAMAIMEGCSARPPSVLTLFFSTGFSQSFQAPSSWKMAGWTAFSGSFRMASRHSLTRLGTRPSGFPERCHCMVCCNYG